MFNRKSACFVVLAACLIVAAGALTVLAGANGHAPDPRSPQIDPFDLMSKAQGLAHQKIENPF